MQSYNWGGGGGEGWRGVAARVPNLAQREVQ
jgi:hypothetical protein